MLAEQERSAGSRAMQAGLKAGLIDPAVGHICGRVPFHGPFAIGHEAITEVVAVGPGVERLKVGARAVVPWSVSCGHCDACARGLTSKCSTARGDRTLAAYGFGPASGSFGGMVTDLLRVPFASHARPAPRRPRPAAHGRSIRQPVRRLANRRTPAARSAGRDCPHRRGGAQSIGLYAAGLAVAHGASVVDYADSSGRRRGIAESLGATAHERARRSVAPRGTYDIVVEASSSTAGIRHALRSTAPGGVCTAVGYYLMTNTGIPLMHMYANDITLHLGVSHPRAFFPTSWPGSANTTSQPGASPLFSPTGTTPPRRTPSTRRSSYCTARR
jgi:alcohol dehydrogenase